MDGKLFKTTYQQRKGIYSKDMKINKNKKMQKKNQQCKKMNKKKRTLIVWTCSELKRSIYATITAPLILLFKFIQNEKSFLSCCVLVHHLCNNITYWKKKILILTDISYQNDAVFMGRFDSITSPTLFLL
jgi:hypothetical protein